MKGIKTLAVVLCTSLTLMGCNGQGGLSNLGKGALIGSGGGAAAGAGIGTLIGLLTGNAGKGAAIGAAVGLAAGGTAGTLIGNKMDKAAKKAAELEGAQAQLLEDANGIKYVKVTFDGGILFATGKSDLTATAKSSLNSFVSNALTSDMNVAIVGYTDNAGFKGYTAAQSVEKNKVLSQERAQSVSKYLTQCGANAAQIVQVAGMGQENPVADNSTAAGKALNRRVEVFMIPSEEMIKAANAGTLK